MKILNAFEGVFFEIWKLLLEMSPYLLFGLLIAGLLHVLFPSQKIYKYFSGNSIKAILRASLFGVPLPLCSCGVIPVAAHLKKDGAGDAPTLSFLISTPTTGIDSIFATYALLGPVFAIIRPVSAFFAGCLAGIMILLLNKKSEEIKIVEEECISCEKSPSKKPGILLKVKEILRYAFFELLDDIGKWLAIGIIAGGVIGFFAPEKVIETYLGNPLMAYPLMLVIAVPLYVCATGSIPIAASLIMKGMTPGAGLIFLIAGPATNTATLSFVGGKMGKKTLFIYLATIIITSLLCGYAIDVLYNATEYNIYSFQSGKKIIPFSVKVLSSVVLVFFMLISFFKIFFLKGKKVKGDGVLFDVPDVSCENCRLKISSEIRKLPGVESVNVDLRQKKVEVKGEFENRDIIDAIEKAGYISSLYQNKKEDKE